MNTSRTLTTLALLIAGATLAVAQPADRPSPEDRRARLLEQQARIEAQLKALDEQPTAQPQDRNRRERFERPHQENPERAKRFEENRRNRLEEMNTLRDTDPEQYRRRVETMQALKRAGDLAAEVAALEDAGKQNEANTVRAQLRAEAEFVFDRTIERQQAELAKNEERLKAAKARLENAIKNRDARLEERIEKAIQRARTRNTP